MPRSTATQPLTPDSLTRLWRDNIFTLPQHYDWIYDDTYETVYPDFTTWEEEDLRAYAHDNGIADEGDIDQLRELVEEFIYDASDRLAPMMNYYYDITLHDHFPGDAQSTLLLAHLPVIVVAIPDPLGGWRHVLALSGGGMDLRWEICEAYIRLHQRPPLYFCDLPHMAGRGESEHDQVIIAACRETLQCVQSDIDAVARRLDSYRKES